MTKELVIVKHNDLEELIFKHLNRYYFVSQNDWCFDVIKIKDSNEVKNQLKEELINIFSLSDKETQYVVEKWANMGHFPVTLEHYWENHSRLFISPGIYTAEFDQSIGRVVRPDKKIKPEIKFIWVIPEPF